MFGQLDVRGVIHLGRRRCNVDKFPSLHLVKDGSRVEAVRPVRRWGAGAINTAGEQTEVKLAGCNMNSLGGWGKIIGDLKVWTSRVRGKLASF